MKNILLLILFFLSGISYSQDTLQKITINYNYYSYEIVVNKDTIESIYTREGILFSEKTKRSNGINEVEKRFYPTGEVMSISQLDSSLLNGTSTYFSKKGKTIAKLIWKNDSLVSTEFLSKNYSILVGKTTQYSRMYGGVDYGDGRSNISTYKGPMAFTDFYAVKLDSTVELQSKYAEFTTDRNGNFAIIVENGDYGLFTKYFKIENVKPAMGSQGVSLFNSSHGGWNISEPISVAHNEARYVHLHHASSSYAP